MTAGLRYGVEVRSAQLGDAPELARLLVGIGQPVSPRDMAERLEVVRLHAACLVATGYERLSGVVALDFAPNLLHPRPVARINLLLVDAEERRHGIGRLLLKSASQAARLAGCDLLELLAGDGTAKAFCLANGFQPHGIRFARSLRKKA